LGKLLASPLVVDPVTVPEGKLGDSNQSASKCISIAVKPWSIRTLTTPAASSGAAR